MNKKLVNTIVVSTLVTGLAIGGSFYSNTSKAEGLLPHEQGIQKIEEDFEDVKKTDWFYNDVKEARRLGIVAGMNNNRFNPNGKITYAQFLTVLSIIVDSEVTNRESTGNWYDKFIESSRELGVIGPFENVPANAEIKREVMIKYTCRALGIEPATSDEAIFEDVNLEEFTGYINAAFNEYLTEGEGRIDENLRQFGFGNTATRAQLATMALRIKEYKENPEEFKARRAEERAEADRKYKEGLTHEMPERITVYPGFSIRKEYSDHGQGHGIVPGLDLMYEGNRAYDNKTALEMYIRVDSPEIFPIEPQLKEAHTVIQSKYGKDFADEVLALMRQKPDILSGFGTRSFERDGKAIILDGFEMSRTTSFLVYK